MPLRDKVLGVDPCPQELVELSLRLGNPALDLSILAEGNTSCRAGDNFWVKASGTSLSEITGDQFVQCRSSALLDCFGSQLQDEDVSKALMASVVRPFDSIQLRPSVEAFMHAWLLSIPKVNFVAHTHPTAIISLVCSPDAIVLCKRRFFPDEVVCCGVATAWVPYVDPGLPLAEKIEDSVSKFIQDYGDFPKVIWLQNHGVITLGKSAMEAESAMLMNVKVARAILLAGGIPSVEKEKILPLSNQAIERIRTRPDEHYRQELLWKVGGQN